MSGAMVVTGGQPVSSMARRVAYERALVAESERLRTEIETLGREAVEARMEAAVARIETERLAAVVGQEHLRARACEGRLEAWQAHFGVRRGPPR